LVHPKTKLFEEFFSDVAFSEKVSQEIPNTLMMKTTAEENIDPVFLV